MVEMSSLHEESNAQLARTPIVRVIDDDDKVRRSWQFVLEGEGWQVQAYESAVRFLKEDDPQVPGCIVCDVRMPEMSGIELQTEMKRAGNRMPLVLISAHADLVMAVKAVKVRIHKAARQLFCAVGAEFVEDDPILFVNAPFHALHDHRHNKLIGHIIFVRRLHGSLHI